MYTSVHTYGSNILYRGYNDNGAPIQEKVKYKPTYFLASEEKSDWKALDGTNVTAMKFAGISEAKEFIKTYSEVDNFTVYGDINFSAQFIAEKFPGVIKYNPDHIAVGNIDIEVESEDGFPEPDEAKYPVISIAYKNSKTCVWEVWGMGDYNPKDRADAGLPEGAIVRYTKCKDEEELLMLFLEYWSNHYPDVVTGWNVRLFDIAYLVNRVMRLFGENMVKKFSPWGIVQYRNIKVKGKTLDAYEIYGIQQLDYMDIFQKFGFSYGKQETYALNHIAHVVLGQKKLSYEEHGSLHGLHKADYQKFINYNLRDVRLVDMLEEETGLLALTFMMAYKGGVNYTDTFGTIAIWDSILYRYLYEKKIAIPPSQHHGKMEYPGGYVKTPIPGRKKWTVSFDLDALYPMTIVQYNMSPETIVTLSESMPNDALYYLNDGVLSDEIRTRDLALSANGVPFRKDIRGMLPSIIEDYYAERKVIKKNMLDTQSKYEISKTPELKRMMNMLNNQQMTIKILLNSLYGSLGARHFRYFDLRIAEGITTSGQLAAMWAEKYINIKMNEVMQTTDVDYVLYMDTDSLYVNFEPMIAKINPADPVKFLDKACAQVFEKTFEEAYAKLFTYLNAYKNTTRMKREAIASAAIWVAKKNYILNVHNSEGVQYAEPKLKVTGIAAVKSSTPQVVRDKFKLAYRIMLDEGEESLHTFVADFRATFSSLGPEEVSSPRGVSDIDKWVDSATVFKKGTPIHVRGSILFNNRAKNIGLKLEPIKNGAKIKYCYLKMPNPIGENVISFPQFLPKELGLHDFIDYEKQFNKAFADPLKLVTNPIGWHLEHVNTLEGFFS